MYYVLLHADLSHCVCTIAACLVIKNKIMNIYIILGVLHYIKVVIVKSHP